ncbi:hypothetical protein [Streptomyces canus]|uniref:hypothetical protein n=1 Tax=Streptomyces canus TaxID=58343 RepID=UPI003CEC96A0
MTLGAELGDGSGEIAGVPKHHGIEQVSSIVIDRVDQGGQMHGLAGAPVLSERSTEQGGTSLAAEHAQQVAVGAERSRSQVRTCW